MANNSVDTALQNLDAIKNGNDPRSTVTPTSETESDDPLEIARSVVAELYDEHDLAETLPEPRSTWMKSQKSRSSVAVVGVSGRVCQSDRSVLCQRLDTPSGEDRKP